MKVWILLTGCRRIHGNCWNNDGRLRNCKKERQYGHGYSSPYYQESTHDPGFENAELMCNYNGRTYSASYADLEFTLIDVSDDGNQIQVVFHKCQYEYTGIDLGTVYTGYLYDISGAFSF